MRLVTFYLTFMRWLGPPLMVEDANGVLHVTVMRLLATPPTLEDAADVSALSFRLSSFPIARP
jgi:hypothetical protein